MLRVCVVRFCLILFVCAATFPHVHVFSLQIQTILKRWDATAVDSGSGGSAASAAGEKKKKKKKANPFSFKKKL